MRPFPLDPPQHDVPPAEPHPFYFGGLVEAGAAGKAVGLYLIAWGIFSLYMFVATFRINVGLVVVFGLLVITFALDRWSLATARTPP